MSTTQQTKPLREIAAETSAAIARRIETEQQARGNYAERLDDLAYAVQCAAHYGDHGALARVRRELGLTA